MCFSLFILLPLSGCGSESFTEIENERSPLISGFESYVSLKEVTGKLAKDVAVKVVTDSSRAKNSSQPPYKLHSISLAPFEHLDHQGKLLLTFYNDRLERTDFYPEDIERYIGKLKNTGLILEYGKEVIQGNTVIWQGKDPDQIRFVGWADKRLRAQQQRWLVHYE